MSRWLGLLLLLLGACAPTDEPLAEPDPGLAELAIVEVAPTTLLPASRLVIRGRSLPGGSGTARGGQPPGGQSMK